MNPDDTNISNLTRLFVIATLFVTVAVSAQVTPTPSAKTTELNTALVGAQEKTPLATSDEAHPDQHLSGTVVDSSGAVIAGVRAALFSLASGRRPTVDHIIQDEEMFI